jgi:nickel/cobalt exporter
MKPVRLDSGRLAILLVAAAVASMHLMGHAHAQSSLGIGTNEAMTPSTGLFAHWMNWINVKQQGFYRSLTGALKSMRQDGGQMWLMVGLSFAYGIFHAAGPGHGKAVISSYMLANEVALKRGVVLSFLSAFLQAVTALILMAAVFLVLRGTAINMTNATWFLEIASYVLVTGFGAWLLWQKAGPRVARLFAPRSGGGLAFAHAHAHSSVTAQGSGSSGGLSVAFASASSTARSGSSVLTGARSRSNTLGYHVHDHTCAHDHGPASAGGMVCETCGHSHAPDPALISGDNFNWRTAWSAVIAVGLRPCTGALIVLSFSFLNGLWVGGIVSVLAMALGTAITVSALATIAVLAKNWAVAIAGGSSRAGAFITAAAEIGGAAMVFLLGLVLLTASLNS